MLIVQNLKLVTPSHTKKKKNRGYDGPVITLYGYGFFFFVF